MSEVLYTQGHGGPMELVRSICETATAYDYHLQELGPIENADEYRQAAYQIEAGNPLHGQTVTLRGEIVVPVVDEDCDVVAMVSSSEVGEAEGIYRGLEVVKLNYIAPDGTLESGYRVVHYLETDTATYFNAVGSRITETRHTFVMAEGIDVRPQGLVNSHSFEYLKNNALADSLTQTIDMIAFSDQSADHKVSRICTLLTTNMHEFIADSDLYQNVFSYINSLGFTADVSVGTVVALYDEDKTKAKLTATVIEFQGIYGLCIANSVLVEGTTVSITDNPGLFYVVIDESDKMFFVPVDPEQTVISASSTA